MRPKYWYLQQVNLFEGMTPDELQRLAEDIIDRSWEKREMIYTPDDELDKVYIIKEGEVTLYRVHDDKRIIIDVLKPGAVFGNIAFVKDTQHGHFAEVSQRAYLCAISKRDFLKIFQARPELAMRLLRMLAERISEYEDKIQALSLFDAKARVLQQIQHIAAKDRKSVLPPILRRKSKLTHEKLAEMTGLTRVTVTRSIHELVGDGKLAVEGREIRMIDGAGMDTV